MKCAVCACILGLVAVVAPASAQQLTMRGDVQAATHRTDGWSPRGHRSTNLWLWGVNLALAGKPFRTQLLYVNTRVGYLSRRTAADGTESKEGRLTLAARLAALRNTRYPIGLSWTRRWSEFVTDPDQNRPGTSVATSMTALAARRSAKVPSVAVHATRARTDTTSPIGEKTFVEQTNLAAAAEHAGTSGTKYLLEYARGWERGTYAEENYRDHSLRFRYSASIPALPRGEVRVTEDYYLRDPTNDDPVNPRYDRNRLSTGLNWITDRGESHGVNYNYSHSLLTVADEPEAELAAHSASYVLTNRVSRELEASGGTSFAYSEAGLGDAVRRGAANSFSAGLAWQRSSLATTYYAGGTGALGIATPTPTLAYAASGRIGFADARRDRDLGAEWRGSISSGSSGLGGWSLSQELRAWFRRSAYDGSLSATSSRISDGFDNVSIRRSAILTVNAAWRQPSELRVGFSDGVAAPLAGAHGDGLFLPAEFNTHSYFGTLNTKWELLGRPLSSSVRSLWSEAPGRLAQWEHGLLLTTSRHVGKVSANLSYQFSIGGTGDFWSARHFFWISLSRSFDRHLLGAKQQRRF